MDEVGTRVAQRGSGEDADQDAPEDEGYGDQWVGSGGWVRVKFQEYTFRLMQASARHNQLELISGDVVNKELLQNEVPRLFGQGWMDAWTNTRNYSRCDASRSAVQRGEGDAVCRSGNMTLLTSLVRP